MVSIMKTLFIHVILVQNSTMLVELYQRAACLDEQCQIPKNETGGLPRTRFRENSYRCMRPTVRARNASCFGTTRHSTKREKDKQIQNSMEASHDPRYHCLT